MLIKQILSIMIIKPSDFLKDLSVLCGLVLFYIPSTHIPFLPYLNNIPLYNEKKKKKGSEEGRDRGRITRGRRWERKGYIPCHLLSLFQI